MKYEIIGFEMKYWNGIADIWLSPSCQWGGLQMPLQSRDAIRKTLEQSPPNVTRLIAVRTSDERVLGTISISPMSGRRSHSAEIGLLVHEEFQGQGIGSALLERGVDLAENWLGILRLGLMVYTDNEHAIRIYQRAGFKTEGIARCIARRNGKFEDALLMGRVSENSVTRAEIETGN
ncbi:GNAT family N-acetyltransferase [Trinickia acidisoli]|uniref:GNAT family N-acetyltransferase n=1 Tax=Trinickia acidisoli TaxID=2767482 RepID=UPI001A8EC733|nr:GNAT family N-acetyltransferase [Trinickia acidisoli]